MLSPEEVKIVEYGKAQGKSKDDVLNALTKYRQANPPKANVAPLGPTSEPDSIGTDFKKRVDAGSDSALKSINGEQSTGSGLLQMFGQGAGFIGDLGMRAIKAITPDFIQKPVGQAVDAVSGEIAKTETAQKISEWAKAHPEASANLDAILNLGTIIPGVGGVGKGAEAGIDAIKTGIKTVAENQAMKQTETQLKDAIKATMPVMSKTDRESAIKAGNVQVENGVITPKPTARDIERATIAKPFIDKNFIKTRDNLANEIVRISTDEVRPALEAHPSIFNQAQFAKQLNDIPMPTAFKADATLEKTYNLVRQRMIDVLHNHPNTMIGLYDARIEFDNVLRNEFGDSAFTSQSTIKRASRDIRAKVNEYINANVGDNIVKDALHKQNLMYEAIENTAEQNQALFGTTKYQRWAKENPKLDKTLRWGLGTGLVGTVGYGLVN